MRFKYLIYMFVVCASQCAFAQSTPKSLRSPENKILMDVTKSLEKNESDETIAQEYVKLAKELFSKQDYLKSEDYYNRAKAIYIKLKNKEKIAYIEREIAKIKEAQNKIPEAIIGYTAANNMAANNMQRSINMHDVSRLQNKSTPKDRAVSIQQKIDVLEQTDAKEEKMDAYRQMAQANIDMNFRDEAISNLNHALDNSAKPSEVIKINRDIANVYAGSNEHEKAIEINKQMLVEAKKSDNAKLAIEQLQTLSNTYFEAKESAKGLESLREAYDLAIEKKQTLDARNSAELLANYYLKQQSPQQAIKVYSDFLSQLEPLVKSDSTLLDNKIFEVHEQKISQLQNEKKLKDQLIEKASIFNYVLAASTIIISIFLLFIIRSWYSIRKKNNKIALQSLRREMNPHFIFNSLNSVNQFIAQSNELEANKYLTSYSKLMRNVMENSNKDFIPLTTELEQMKEYLELEHLRFSDKFSYQIDVDSELDSDALLVPNMLIQPQLENAIWHGLRYHENCGSLTLRVISHNKSICILIDDNGIGLKRSKELKTKHQKTHNSRGLTNTYERISLLNTLYKFNISIHINDKENNKEGDENGVIVKICFPIIYKKDMP